MARRRDREEVSSSVQGTGALPASLSASGGVGSNSTPLDTAPAGQSATGGEGAGQIHHKVHDRYEEYVYVTRDDLREVKTVGWLQQVLAGLGTFFFSGAFWLLVDLFARQERGKFEFSAWMAVCVLSMIFGGALAVVGWIMFGLKQKRLEKYFPKGQT